MPSSRTLRSRATPMMLIQPSGQPAANPSTRSGRLTRGATAGVPASSVTVSRSPPSLAEGSKKSIHLTVKMSSSKLRQVTNSRSSRGTASNRHNIFTDNPVVLGKRSSRNTRNLKEDSEDDDEIDEEEDEEIEDSEDATGEDDEELDADGDLDMEDVTPQPPVSKRSTRPAAAAAKAKNKAVKSVEEKEMELSRNDEEDDEDLSEPDSDAEGEVDDTMLQDEEMGDGVEEEEEGEEVDDEDDDDDEEDDLGSDDDSSTPDLTKLTKRQRGSLGKDFLQLPMEPQVKKHLTAEEHAMRRAEMARRRKNLSEKRNEEEKMDTINRLLKKQAPKRRGRIPATETVGEATPDLPIDSEKPDPTMIRWVSGRDGCKAYVPDEILGTPSGRPFGGFSGGKLIEEV
ncbi:PAPA-1-like conserved region-domain-containing protein [Talaromyces proteolyticus]|uniref:PAPA-1-like conserved region-domain-containing protein n=1 Tax=Talaromyces proteolyticus TaxID=1131652 RepID=A0AAD4PZQ1_9EURO|nr:PAPA-1-like conserved region-domain-containing protein [Talaromyces proteolyticus]KAH8699266.1 PAPA-1-like conserved region-domain-containing protein [Talaromyces proteolyticus]